MLMELGERADQFKVLIRDHSTSTSVITTADARTDPSIYSRHDPTAHPLT
jgi:hypothetical protein